MQIDITTQEIWHFIGSFQQVIEAARGRSAYDAFRAQQIEAAQAEMNLLTGEFKANYKLIDFAGGVQIGWQSVEPEDLSFQGVRFPSEIAGPLGDIALLPNLALASFAPDVGIPGQTTTPQGPKPFKFELPPPSVAVVFAQENRLWDQDVQIHNDLGVTFTPFEVLEVQLQQLHAVAKAMDPLGSYERPSDIPALKATVLQIAEDITDVTGGLETLALHGEATQGVYVNGVAVNELPKLKDFLPDVPEPVTIKPGADPGEVIAAQAEVEPAHIAITGGNSLTNQLTLNVSWLDAPVMLVQGDAVSVQIISQINVLSEITHSSGGAAAISHLFNVAEMATTSRDLPEVPDAKLGEFPKNWVVTTFDADLVNINWMDQSNFVMDNDVLSLTWSGASSFLRMGDNTLMNLASLLELGTGYDLIIIGGDMINMSMIRQMNVLLDADWVSAGGGSAQISSGGNLLWNGAAITGSGIDDVSPMSALAASFAAEAMKGDSGAIPLPWANPAFEGIGTLNVLYITGDYLTVSMISQTNILGDSDQVATMIQNAGKTQGAAVEIHTGANALVNLATIHTGGLDSEIQVAGDYYSDALLYQANFIDADAADPYGANGPTGLASEAVLFLADGMLAEDDGPAGPSGDMTLNTGHLDGVNAVLA